MDSKQKAALIRKGNELFNQGRLKEAIAVFIQADYKDGLARIGDHFLYERKEPVNALSFYKKAGYKKGVDLIIGRIVRTIRDFLAADKVQDKWHSYLEKNFTGDTPSGAEKPEEQETDFHLKMLGERAGQKKSFKGKPVETEKRQNSDLQKLRKKLEDKKEKPKS